MTPRWSPQNATHAAFAIAAERHADKSRKGGDIPYLSHLLAVTALVIENGGGEEQAAAALLHDALEDTGLPADELVEGLVKRGVPGDSAGRILAIVEGTVDGNPDSSRSTDDWWERKAGYHARLAKETSDDPSILVSLADKVHNLESTLGQIRAGQTAAEIYQHFNAGHDLQRWNYETLFDLFSRHAERDARLGPLVTRFRHALHEVFPR